jgi:hypothetical protein
MKVSNLVFCGATPEKMRTVLIFKLVYKVVNVKRRSPSNAKSSFYHSSCML